MVCIENCQTQKIQDHFSCGPALTSLHSLKVEWFENFCENFSL